MKFLTIFGLLLSVGGAAFASNRVQVGAVTNGSGNVGKDVGVTVALSHETQKQSNGDNFLLTFEYTNVNSDNSYNGKVQYVWDDPVWNLGFGVGAYHFDDSVHLGVPVSLIHNFKNGNFLQFDYNFIVEHQKHNTVSASVGTHF